MALESSANIDLIPLSCMEYIVRHFVVFKAFSTLTLYVMHLHLKILLQLVQRFSLMINAVFNRNWPFCILLGLCRALQWISIEPMCFDAYLPLVYKFMCIGVQAKVSVNYYFVANFLFLHICCRPSGTSIWYNDKRLEADSSTHRLQVSFSLPQQVTWTAIPSPSCAAD